MKQLKLPLTTANRLEPFHSRHHGVFFSFNIVPGKLPVNEEQFCLPPHLCTFYRNHLRGAPDQYAYRAYS